MSTLKVFVSSTCYDLDNVRDGLRDFIYNIGHEPVMSDCGDVLYDSRIHTQILLLLLRIFADYRINLGQYHVDSGQNAVLTF